MTLQASSADRAKVLRLLKSAPTVDDTAADHEQSGDWPDASYQCEIESAPGAHHEWIAKHALAGAPGIQALLANGDAHWAVEARCSYALYTALEHIRHSDTSQCVSLSDMSRHTHKVRIDSPSIGRFSDLWLCPGVIVAADGAQLNTAGTPWGNSLLTVGRGRWLVKGAPIRVKASHDARSMIQFVVDDNISDGTAKFKFQQRDGDCYFQISAQRDRINRLKTGDALIICWATALSAFPSHEEFKIEEDHHTGALQVPGSRNANAVMQVLLDSGLNQLWGPSPDDRLEWDPLAAATAFVKLAPSIDPAKGDDESGETDG